MGNSSFPRNNRANLMLIFRTSVLMACVVLRVLVNEKNLQNRGLEGMRNHAAWLAQSLSLLTWVLDWSLFGKVELGVGLG